MIVSRTPRRLLRNCMSIGDTHRPTSSKGCWWIRRAAILIWRTMWTRSWNIAKFVGPLIRRRIYQLWASPRCHCFMRRSKSTLYFRMILLEATPWIHFPKTRCLSPRSHKNPRRFGESFLAGGSASLTHPKSSRQSMGGNGRMRFGQIRAQTDELNCNFKERGHIPGFWNDAMALRVEFITA